MHGWVSDNLASRFSVANLQVLYHNQLSGSGILRRGSFKFINNEVVGNSTDQLSEKTAILSKLLVVGFRGFRGTAMAGVVARP